MSVKPVIQTVTGKGKGNCLAACVASILELPMDAVPDTGGKDSFEQYECLNTWLRARGMALLRVDGMVIPWFTGEVHYILTGPSPRGIRHAVVALGNNIVHDPHPEGGGILDRDGAYFILSGV